MQTIDNLERFDLRARGVPTNEQMQMATDCSNINYRSTDGNEVIKIPSGVHAIGNQGSQVTTGNPYYRCDSSIPKSADMTLQLSKIHSSTTTPRNLENIKAQQDTTAI